MRIAIVGAGVGGRSLWRFLELEGGYDVEIFDVKHQTACGISPCGWGVYTLDFRCMCDALEIPSCSIKKTYTNLQVGEMDVSCLLSTFDKPKFLRQMCPDSNVILETPDISEYDLVVDATGVRRSLLPPVRDDMKVRCRQERYRSTVNDLVIVPASPIGYAWMFPLGDGTVHIGQGWVDWSLTRPDETEKARDIAGVNGTRPECSCTSDIRMLTPAYCKPIAYGTTVGIGEAVGTVSPLCGAGVIPAIGSAMLLADNIDNPYRYEKILLSDFSFLNREVAILRKLIAGKRLNLIDLYVMHRNSHKFGIFYSWKDAIETLKLVGGRLI